MGAAAEAGTGSRSEYENPGRDVNVGSTERVASVVAGGALAAWAAKRHDWAALGLAAAAGMLVWRGTTGHCDVYEKLGVSTADESQHRSDVTGRAATVNAREAIRIDRNVTIDRPAAELFAVWRDFTQLPRFMPHLDRVTTAGDGRWHWVAHLDGGKTAEWDSVLVNEIPDRLIAWKTVGDPDVAHAGSVHFTPAVGGGTEVRVVFDYEPPGAKLFGRIARMFGQSPEQLVSEDLARFKELMEATDGGRVSG